MNDYCDDLETYLSEELGRRLGKKREKAEIIEVLEDLPRGDSESPIWEESTNTMVLSTSKGQIVLEVSDEERRAILDGRINNLIITVTGSKVSVLTVLLSNNGSLDYAS